MSLLHDTLGKIAPVDDRLEPEIRAHLDNLTKPRGSLGHLEELAVHYCLATGTQKPHMGEKVIFVFAGDHGVVTEGVSAYPKEVTTQMVRNMLAGGAAVNILARHAGAEVRVVDIGVDKSFESTPGLLAKKVRPGTANIAEGPAMSTGEAQRAVEAGIELAQRAARGGATLIGTGEMGIGNTTPSSAILAVLLPCSVEQMTGRGSGIDDDTLRHKIDVVERAIAVNRERLTEPLSVLAALGGLEIGGICGLVLGAASYRVPTVVDGFISAAGALIAWRMCPHVRGYLFFSHLSAEAGHGVFFQRVNARPILDLGMRLGEGTGAALAMSIIEAAIMVYNGMSTFDSAGVSKRDG
jgi:nicotinate-nucleotide--dimethylbenzimidazole phosphoribosyltransferase